MPRQSRIDVPGALNHIIARGINRKKIFNDDKDRYNFLSRLGKILTDANTACFAWALVPNHFHLLLRTGLVPISTIMQRLLTGYAMSYNRRHRRHGHLFQNRYKSILCQEDVYLLELVRYIHLNPLRAKLVKDLKALEKYPFSGHPVILGKRKNSWQDAEYILKLFSSNQSAARRGYRQFVEKGVALGKRPDLVGGGLLRSYGGWSAIKSFRKIKPYQKGDERILGNSDFVEQVLSAAEEKMKRKYLLRARGMDLEKLTYRVADLLKIKPEDVWASGKHQHTVEARSLLCFWATAELGITQSYLASKLRISQPAVGLSVKRGERLAKLKHYLLIDE
ncbi:MAG: transposase [Desulfobacterales bacterium]|jgi:REP element-mobilizing transposase RayT